MEGLKLQQPLYHLQASMTVLSWLAPPRVAPSGNFWNIYQDA